MPIPSSTPCPPLALELPPPVISISKYTEQVLNDYKPAGSCLGLSLDSLFPTRALLAIRKFSYELNYIRMIFQC